MRRRTMCCLGESSGLKSALRGLESEILLCLGEIDRCKEEIENMRQAAESLAGKGVPFAFNRSRHKWLLKRIDEEEGKMLKLKEQRDKVVKLVEEYPLL